MMQNRLWLIPFFLFLLLTFTTEAQSSKTKKPAKKTTTQKSGKKTPVKKPPAKKSPAKQTPVKQAEEKNPAGAPLLSGATDDEQKVKDIVAFLQYMLNTLGS